MLYIYLHVKDCFSTDYSIYKSTKAYTVLTLKLTLKLKLKQVPKR